ncbi:MAG: hypothetical protein U0744_21965 [Gemmataceae bacterium]
MQSVLETNEDRMGAVFETIVTSPQFRNQRLPGFLGSVVRQSSERKKNE